MERNSSYPNSPRKKSLWGRTLSWCREHVLLSAAVLAVPFAAGAFFWSRGTAEVSVIPDYWSDFQDETGQPANDTPPKLEEAPVTPVFPAGQSGPDSTGRLGLAAGEEFLEPLPASADTLELIEKRNRSGCVWLTGKIEPLEPTALMHSASRVHELTRPARQ